MLRNIKTQWRMYILWLFVLEHSGAILILLMLGTIITMSLNVYQEIGMAAMISMTQQAIIEFTDFGLTFSLSKPSEAVSILDSYRDYFFRVQNTSIILIKLITTAIAFLTTVLLVVWAVRFTITLLARTFRIVFSLVANGLKLKRSKTYQNLIGRTLRIVMKIPSDTIRVNICSIFLDGLPEVIIEDLLTIPMENGDSKAKLLIKLADVLPSNLIEKYLSVAQKSIYDEKIMNRALSSLANRFTSDLLWTIIECNTKSNEEIRIYLSLTRVLLGSNRLPQELNHNLIDVIRTVPHPSGRSILLSYMADLVSDTEKSRILAESFEAASEIDDRLNRTVILSQLLESSKSLAAIDKYVQFERLNPRLSKRRRPDFFSDMRLLSQLILPITDSPNILRMHYAIRDLMIWWP